jgi:hypothetical protein
MVKQFINSKKIIMNAQLNNEEKLNLPLENELLKMQLELEHGASFFETSNHHELDPEIENQFLKYVQQFENLHQESPLVTVRQKLNNPTFKSVTNIQEEDIEKELSLLLKTLHEGNVSIDSICGISAREMYRFITEELLNHEMYDMYTMPGMKTCFIYEEFYPEEK